MLLPAVAVLVALAPMRAMAASSADALVGNITSDAEGRMEGVLVIAKREGSAALTAVVTDAQGQYRFPRTHLAPGNYSIRIRAAGYVIPNGSESVTVDADRVGQLNLRVRQSTTDELAHQLTNVDWWASMPGSAEQKDILVRKLGNCGFCHDVERIARSRYSAEQFLSVMRRMAIYAPDNSSGCGTGSDLWCDAKSHGREQITGPPPPADRYSYGGADARGVAEYLASVNLSGGKTSWNYPLKAMPRPKGRATRVIVTVFPIPRQPSVVHDLAVDMKGNVWFGDNGWGYLGKLDPKTAQFSEYEAPNMWPDPRPGSKRLVGVQDVEVDTTGNIWISAINGNGMTYFNPATEKWVQFEMPAATWAFLPSFRPGLNTIWTTGREQQPGGPAPLKAFRLNYITRGVEASFPILFDDAGKDISGPQRLDVFGHQSPVFPLCYQIEQDRQGNFLCADFYGSRIIRVDAKTGARTTFQTPTSDAAPRRGRLDSEGRFWFGEFWGDKLGLLDFKTGTIREFPFSAKYMSGYAAAGNQRGEGWGTSHGSDRVLRVNPATGERIEYLMPVYTDARKIVFDPSTTKTTVWLPNKNLAQLIRIEPQD